ncbi:MAG: glycerophosphodiester phosphodiesterase [Clostridia bacterium]|nr:glycerophosphodiester phosphodiesterase [Clostridia bacterium]MBQ2274513.1 glycerophosphodiester phosphodiesterase [Clostridia bacterium]MEE1278836.1 glycerophosphodiester phosphodiesterase family protein [Acutalibacteraceae bacterium]
MIPLLITVLVLLAIMFFLIAPTLRRHPDREILSGLDVAHRGLHDLESDTPENSIAAFLEAAARGYAIENDIHLIADGNVVVFHDYTLKRMCGEDVEIEKCTLQELKKYTLGTSGEKIPTLKECLDAIDGRVPLLIEFKTESFKNYKALCAAANEILKDYKGKYFVQSFFPPVLYWYRKNRRDILRGQLATATEKETLAKRLMGYLVYNFMSRPDFVSYDIRSVKNIMFRIVKCLGALPVGWTIRNEEEYKKAKKSFKTYIFENFLAK